MLFQLKLIPLHKFFLKKSQYNMKKLVFVASLMVLLLGSCKSYKEVPYLKNSDTVDLSQHKELYDARIKPKDEFNVIVKDAVDDDAVRMFNLHMYNSSNMDGGNSSYANAQVMSSMSSPNNVYRYTVTNEGDIEFPVLGRIHCAGMTRNELENHIADKIEGTYTKDRPVVIVTFTNFHVAVLGEVNRPGIVNSSNGKINLFEALAQSGDLTLYGRRDNVKIIREEEDGQKKIYEVCLNDANVIKSDVYQLQQNDIVYVTPNKTRAKASGIGQDVSIWMSSSSMLMSVANMLINILRK